MDKVLFPPHNFLGIPSGFAAYENSEFVILPVPYEQTTTYQKGTQHAPRAIIAASREVETFDEELKFEAISAGICTLNYMETNQVEPWTMLQTVYRTVGQLIEENKKVTMIGGEHTVSIGAVKAFKEKYSQLCVLQMDAHADLRDSYQKNRYSHACVMRRVGEITDFVGVGIRNLSKEEHEFIQLNQTDIYFAPDMKKTDIWKEKVLDGLSSEVYLTFDMDVLDPGIMPAVGTPEPGGLLWYETLDFLKELIYRKNLVGFDLVELCPIPGLVAPDFLAARLIYKVITYWVDKKRKGKLI